MPRARLLKPDFFNDEKMAELPFAARLLFQALWCEADREGRLEDRPQEVAGLPLLWLPHFKEHQHIHDREAQSGLPSAPQDPQVESEARPRQEVSIPRQEVARPRKEKSAGSIARKHSTEAEASREAEAEERAPAHPFALAFAREHQNRNAGRPPPPTQHAEAIALEDEHGADWCFRAAEAFGWTKTPSYLRPWIIDHKERAHVNTGRTSSSESGSATDTNGVADRVPDMDRRSAAIADRRRRGVPG